MTVNMSESNENMDVAQHEHTYSTFIALLKYGTASVIIILVLMALFLL
jgi:hypothetical protein